ncbi:putative C-S lyase [Granulicatella sp. zg-ZJ]|nr:putative C-S lyase [Granulicatella sp. zg-ZJ]
MRKRSDYMQTYDFDTLINRQTQSSKKWELMHTWATNIPEHISPFSVADADLKTAPEIVEGLQEYIQQTVLGYTTMTPDYKKAIKQWNKDQFNWDIEEEWIATSPGIVSALHSAIYAFTQPNDNVLIMTPVYPQFKQTVLHTGRTVLASSLINDFPTYHIDFQDLEEKMSLKETTLMILCSPHNPVGRVWTKEELDKIISLALTYDVLIVSDEIHYDLIMPNHTHHVLPTLSKEIEQKCIVCTAPSKSFNLAGLQISSIIIPNETLRERFTHTQLIHGVPSANMIGMQATAIAYTQGKQWLEAFLALIWTNHLTVKDFMETHLPKVKVYALQGTYLQWLDFSAYGFSTTTLQNLLRQDAFVFCNEGYTFGKEGYGFERLNLACPTSTLIDALHRLKDSLSRYEH